MTYTRILSILAVGCLSMTLGESTAALATQQFAISEADERWLDDDVAPLITKDEAAAYRTVRPEYRGLFVEIFWLRRDPDLSTPANEFRQQYESRQERAVEMFRMGARDGTSTEIGRIYLLMGDPDRTGKDSPQAAAEGSGSRTGRGGSPQGDNPVTRSGLGGRMAGSERAEDRPGRAQDMIWIYEANTDLKLRDELVLDFRLRPPLGWMLSTPDTEEIFDSVREARITNPNIIYDVSEAGDLSRPAELDAFELSAAEVILSELRESLTTEEDFSFKPSVSFFYAADGTVYSPLLLEIDPAGWDWNGGRADAVVFGGLETSEGDVVFGFEQSVTLQREDPRVSIPLQADPGVYQLLIGLHDAGAERVGTKIIALPLPGIAPDVLATSTVLMLSSFERNAAEPTVGNAYQFADLKLEPNPTGLYGRNDELLAFYYVYGFHADDSGAGKLTAQYRFYLDGEPYKQYRAKELPADGYQSADMVQLPLADFDPGSYQIEIIIRDEVADTSISKVMAFQIEG